MFIGQHSKKVLKTINVIVYLNKHLKNKKRTTNNLYKNSDFLVTNERVAVYHFLLRQELSHT